MHVLAMHPWALRRLWHSTPGCQSSCLGHIQWTACRSASLQAEQDQESPPCAAAENGGLQLRYDQMPRHPEPAAYSTDDALLTACGTDSVCCRGSWVTWPCSLAAGTTNDQQNTQCCAPAQTRLNGPRRRHSQPAGSELTASMMRQVCVAEGKADRLRGTAASHPGTVSSQHWWKAPTIVCPLIVPFPKAGMPCVTTGPDAGLQASS